MQPLSSATTGLMSKARAVARNPGSALGRTESSSLPAVASRELLASEPAQTDRRLEASLEPSLKQWLFWRAEKNKLLTRGESPTHDRMMASYRKATRPEWVEEALRSYRLAVLPAPADVLAKEIGAMCALTVRRGESQDDTAVYIVALVPRLQQFPGDVAVDVLRSQPDVSKWRPAWEELLVRLEGKTTRRKATLRMLEEMA